MENTEEDKWKYYVAYLIRSAKNNRFPTVLHRYVFLNPERAVEEEKRCEEAVKMYAKPGKYDYLCYTQRFKTYKMKKGDEIMDNEKDIDWSFKSRRRLK